MSLSTVEIRLASVRTIISFMAEQIRQRYFDTVPAPDELLSMTDKSEWIRKWIRAEGPSGR
jgi:hypothetical protein